MVYTFLDFELDEDLFELRSRGEVVSTQARAFELIQYLMHHRERVVSKEELTRVLWKGAVVSDTAISQAVMLARKALRDEGDRQHVIKTVRGRGFRFIAEVGLVPPNADVKPLVSVPVLEPEPSPKPTAAREARNALFGRGLELRRLLTRLEGAEAGHGGLLLVGGEPGIGKTALASEFAELASARGAEVLWGRAWEEGGAPPFWPWIQVLRGLLEREGLAVLRSALGSSVHELAPLLPELADAAMPATTHELDGPHARFRQFDALARLLRELQRHGRRASCRRCTRVIILEDLHAVDEASVQLLRFLLPELHELALVFIATYREFEVAPGSALSGLIECCTGTSQLLGLRAIEPTAAVELLERNLGRPVSSRDGEALFALSGGNPLLLAALAHRLAADGGGDSWLELSQLSEWPLPERIAGAVRKHLAQLPPRTRELLSAASAFGREFPLQVLAQLGACSEPELLEQLEPARQRHVLRPAATGPSHLAFAHGLVCSAVYSEIAPARRIELHRQIAELLEQSFAPEQWPLYELAHHYDRAAADGCRDKAIEFARRAAVQAERMTAYEAAASLYERALSHAQLSSGDSLSWYELSCNAGGAFYRAGQIDRAASCFDRAGEFAHKTGDIERTAWAQLAASTALRGSVQHEATRQRKLRETLDRLPPGDSPVRALLTAVSLLGVNSGHSLSERRRIAAEAVEMARRLGDLHVLQWTLNVQHFTLWGVAPPEEMLAIASEIVQLSRTTGDNELMLDGMLWRMADCGDLGDIQTAIRYRTEYASLAEQFGSPWHRYMVLGSAHYHACCQGEFAEAAEISEQLRVLGQRVGESVSEGFYHVRKLFLDYHRGAPPTALQAPDSVPEAYRIFWALPAALSNKPEPARRALHTLLANPIEASILHTLRLPTLAIMGAVAVLLQDYSAVERLYALLCESEGRHLNLQPWVYLGPVSYYLGLMSHALGESSRALEHLEAALRATEESPPFRAYVQLEYGRVALATNARERGRDILTSARLAAQAFGMKELCRKASVALEACAG